MKLKDFIKGLQNFDPEIEIYLSDPDYIDGARPIITHLFNPKYKFINTIEKTVLAGEYDPNSKKMLIVY